MAHPAVNLNVQTLRDMNYQIIQPASGEQACGDVGAGRLPEPEQLLDEVLLFIAMNTTPQLLAGKRVVITAGPTVEAIDLCVICLITLQEKWALHWRALRGCWCRRCLDLWW
nr:hypothetical protein [Psychrobacter sp. JCM 18901]